MRRTTLERMGKHMDDLKNAEDVFVRNGHDRQVVRNISKRMNGVTNKFKNSSIRGKFIQQERRSNQERK